MPGLAAPRIAIKNALLAQCQNAIFFEPIAGNNTWVTTSRRLKLWGSVDASQQPALFLTQHREGYEHRGTDRLIRRWLDMQLWCYANSGDPTNSTIIGDDLLDIMEGALENALAPPAGEVENTLGNLVYWCRIMKQDNIYIRDPGDIDGQALLVLPVRILIP